MKRQPSWRTGESRDLDWNNRSIIEENNIVEWTSNMAGTSSQVSKQPFHETYELKEELGKYVFFEADWNFFFDVCLTFVCRIFLSEVLSASFAGVCIRRQKLSMPRKLSTPGNCRPEVRIEFSAVFDTDKLLLPYWTLSFKFKSLRFRIILVIFIFNWGKKENSIDLLWKSRLKSCRLAQVVGKNIFINYRAKTEFLVEIEQPFRWHFCFTRATVFFPQTQVRLFIPKDSRKILRLKI